VAFGHQTFILYCNLTRIAGALAPDQREADQHVTHQPDIFKKHVLNYEKNFKTITLLWKGYLKTQLLSFKSFSYC
jgi:hypothetical protein